MALYTKYRPSDFDNLVGQTFIKETLKKAIAEEKTVGAYLFCGPRGTGKTSTARLFAKTVNCLNQKDGNPCLECEICKEFASESLVDIVEIDAASHTGVDNIREIIEKAQFSPTKTKYKIYIIDEVHMLSKGAFNALLKILEEPPAHVKFILATTETHKVPETIISRCQRYDFKRISETDIKERLKFIANSENVSIDEKSLEYIVGASAGGMRNAISLFEQMISESEITYENIVKQLGITNKEELEGFLKCLLNQDKKAIELFEKLIASGKNIKLFMKDLIFFTKKQAIENLKQGEAIGGYINILEILDESYTKSKHSLDEETTFLVGILKIVENYTSPSTPLTTKKETKKELHNGTQTEENIVNNNFSPIPKEKEQNGKNHIESEVNSELSSADLNDIFGGDDLGFSEQKNEENTESLVSEVETDQIPKIETSTKDNEETPTSQNFSLPSLLSKLKENGAKGAVIFSLRGANISISGNTCSIKAPTKVVKNTLINTENGDLIRKSLSDIGMGDMVLDIQ